IGFSPRPAGAPVAVTATRPSYKLACCASRGCDGGGTGRVTCEETSTRASRTPPGGIDIITGASNESIYEAGDGSGVLLSVRALPGGHHSRCSATVPVFGVWGGLT